MNPIMPHDLTSRVFPNPSAGETCRGETHELDPTTSGGLLVHPQPTSINWDDSGV
jgi:hypothetical protein